MYLKLKLTHCCYLTVTVNLLLSVIYWRPGERAALFYSRVTDPSGRRPQRGGATAISPYLLLKYIFCTETQKCSVHFYNNAELANAESGRRGTSGRPPRDRAASARPSATGDDPTVQRKKGRTILTRDSEARPHLPVLS